MKWLRSPRNALGAVLVAVVLVAALLGPALWPYAPDVPDFAATLAPPSFVHWFGTDDLGRDYVTAERALGFGTPAILLRCVLPNATPAIVVQASLLLASSIITEAYLSFLGLGVQPPTPSWGNMLHDAVGFLDQAEWLAWFPGLAIFATVLGFNLLGDALRDGLDPHD
jgi:ABC-type dipeptide/oligopeptide/nickel transport system permease subunit